VEIKDAWKDNVPAEPTMPPQIDQIVQQIMQPSTEPTIPEVTVEPQSTPAP
jgi:hypothetical protein